MKRFSAVFALVFLLLLAGCGAALLFDPSYRPIHPGPHGWEALEKDPSLARRILAVDPAAVSPADIRDTLSKGPTPWLMAIAPLAPWSEEFLRLIEFFIGMGYPPDRIGDPRIPDFRVDWLEKPSTLGGMSAWFYEHDGMAPMFVGWSGGGILVIRVMHGLNGSPQTEKVRMVNARTGKTEDRDWYRDFYTKKKKPIRSLRIPFVASLAAGGLGRAVQPETWPVIHGLNQISDNAEEFLGFKSPDDMLGTDLIGYPEEDYIRANEFVPMGAAKVRSIIADESYHHFEVVHCNDLLETPEGRRWAESFRPDPGFGLRDYRRSKGFSLVEGKRNLWCGELWYGIRKHWALSAQRVARAFLASGKPRPRRVSGPQGLGVP